jgi:large subunit ribosomal protein L21
MYAVIESGGKQYRVELGSEFAVERLAGDPGQTIEIERVLLVADGDETAIGRPVVENARVSVSVVRQDRADKVVVFKYRPKARTRVKKGHRQQQTILRVSDIVLGRRSAAKEADAARTERQRLEAAEAEAAAKQAAADKALADKLAREKAKADADKAAESKSADTKKKGTAKPAGTKADAARTAKPAAKASAKPATAKADTKGASKPRTTRARTQAPEPDQKPKGTRSTKKDE